MLRRRGSSCAPHRGPWGRNARDAAGQMSVELAIALPALLAVAVISMNALLLLGECASFDRLAREAVRTCAASPAYGISPSAAAADAQARLAAAFPRDFESVSVQAEGASPGYITYTATLSFQPTLLGRAFSGSVFGVSLPPMRHSVRMVVDSYKPGGLL